MKMHAVAMEGKQILNKEVNYLPFILFKKMTEEVKNYFNKLLSSVEGLLAIVITDRDGVPVLKVATEQTPDLVLRQSFLATFGMASDQAKKLGLSQNKSIISMYEHHQVVQLNKAPLLLTFIATSDANTGLLLDMDNSLKDILQDLRRVVPAS